MADNTNAQAVKITNEHVRPAADYIAQTYWKFKRQIALDDAQGWDALFPAGDPTGEIIDGSRQDGRKPVRNTDVQAVRTIMRAFVNFMEATNNQRLNQILVVAVNVER